MGDGIIGAVAGKDHGIRAIAAADHLISGMAFTFTEGHGVIAAAGI